ncbi:MULTISPECIES: hypothetical protein [unclassified Thermoactinomyces]|uniref:hypothetical protein n=1 Tax=unclassified Thermoactinomyces TaxID=2634588 RepID=UPI0018DDD48E|nr:MULTISPECIES: hypothetical protein [unclassified Thermoactinomyces]MBH8596784.1 hypothetical protein [Thermoactinomyces sp. CICC 10523]MBH8603545.1 hypothetical protein [Thermoactinomyces sp. CICC 10522]MBH8606709.1 hypothetical protein [Thermoactinomyces sp. CICC 10521]
MKQELHTRRRYYERFQVEDVINFFSGQLLQAKSPDGAQVFLQSIKVTRRPLPSGYKDVFRRMQHPHLAPILDVMEEDEQLILVHPPFSGDPLPLIVNKERAMDPEAAVRVVSKCLKTLRDLDRLPVSLSATLDPKNILLNGQKPLILFYYMKEPGKSGHDEKWRELLFYLLTGHAPMGGLKQSERQLEAKKIPPKIVKLAMFALDRKNGLEDFSVQVERHVNSAEGSHLSRRARRSRKKKVVTTVVVAAAALVLVSLTVTKWYAGYSDAKDSTLANMFAPITQDDKQNGAGNGQLFQSITFNDQNNSFKYPYPIKPNSAIQGSFILNQLNGFTGYLETPDKSDILGLAVDKEGKIKLYDIMKGQYIPIGDSGDQYRVEAGKKYNFELYYFPNEPIRLSIEEEGKSKKWMAVGVTRLSGDYTLHFRGGNGVKFFYPDVNQVTNQNMFEQMWMNQQPWRIDFGQALLDVDSQGRNQLGVYPLSQVRLDASASSSFLFVPPQEKGSYSVEIEAVDNSHFRLVWDKKTNKFALYKIGDQPQKVAEQEVPWKSIEDGEPLQVSITSNFNQLSVNLTYDSNSVALTYTNDTPVMIKDITLRDAEGFRLVENKTEQQDEKGDRES